MQCPYFDTHACRSCALMGEPYSAQLAHKQARMAGLLAGQRSLSWLKPVPSAPQGFRNKAKMAVRGDVLAPTLGILDAQGHGVDLRQCALYPPGLADAFEPLARFIALADLVPYDVADRRGELKYIHVTISPDDELMVRFVLRSQEAVGRIRKHLPALSTELPQLVVASANILPEHRAALEGTVEIPLTDVRTLTMRVGKIALHLRPGGFFQTNTTVAAALYDQARQWARDIDPHSVWDLYCGVGGFAAHLAAPGRIITGVETHPEAVAAAQRTVSEAGIGDVSFHVADATEFARDSPTVPDLVVVNPPRRGIGAELSSWLESSGVPRVIYSSCDGTTLARDLESMPSLQATSGRVLDMFPQTDHCEVAVLLERSL